MFIINHIKSDLPTFYMIFFTAYYDYFFVLIIKFNYDDVIQNNKSFDKNNSV